MIGGLPRHLRLLAARVHRQLSACAPSRTQTGIEMKKGTGAPNRTRTGVLALRGLCPKPLDDGSARPSPKSLPALADQYYTGKG